MNISTFPSFARVVSIVVTLFAVMVLAYACSGGGSGGSGGGDPSGDGGGSGGGGGGSGSSDEENAYLKASNAGEEDWFGEALSLSSDGNTLAVGAPYEDGESDLTADSGAVYVFTRDITDDSWSEQTILRAANPGAGDYFGEALSLSSDGNTLAVGAHREDGNDNLTEYSGAVYVFTRSGDSWSEQTILRASNAGEDDRFGEALSLSSDGNTLAVGAAGEDGASDSDFSSGAVYVFTLDDNGSWTQKAYLKAANAGAGDYFGEALSLSPDGNTLAVGASLEDGASNSTTDSGAVYVFTRSGDSWSEQTILRASNAGEEDWFGGVLSLSSDGNTLAVGVHREDGEEDGADISTDSGAVYVFTRSGDSWSEQTILRAANAGADDEFGEALSLSSDGNTLAVGARYEDGASDLTENSGAVYVFTRSDGASWSEPTTLRASNARAYDWFGEALSLSSDGNTLAVGAPQKDGASDSTQSSGAVYIY